MDKRSFTKPENEIYTTVQHESWCTFLAVIYSLKWRFGVCGYDVVIQKYGR